MRGALFAQGRVCWQARTEMLPTDRGYWYGRHAQGPPVSEAQSASVQHGPLHTEPEQTLPAQVLPVVHAPPLFVSPSDDAQAWTTPVGVPLRVTTSHWQD
jgi:hypothetical protein